MVEMNGIVKIDCGEKSCGDCKFLEETWQEDWCRCFMKPIYGERCQQCLETFKPEEKI
jgi:hypothetical protein